MSTPTSPLSSAPARAAARVATTLLAATLLAACGVSGQVRDSRDPAATGAATATATLDGTATASATATATATVASATGMAGMSPDSSGTWGSTDMDPNVAPPNPCGSVTAAGFCDGNMARVCVGGAAIQVTDCTLAAQACVTTAQAGAHCAPQTLGSAIQTFDINGAPTSVTAHTVALAGSALVYTVTLPSGAIYQIACQPTASGRSCAAGLPGQAPALTVTFVRSSGLTVTAGSQNLGGPYGPTVLRAADLVQVADANALVLLDRNVLTALPAPTGDANQMAVYTSVLALGPADAADPAEPTGPGAVWDTVRFRADLTALSSAQRSSLAALIGSELSQSFVAEHMMICHGQGWLTPGASFQGATYAFGGFTNGHRTYMREMENFIQTAAVSSAPFRRLPVYDPANAVPPEFMLNVANANIDMPLPAGFSPGNPALMAYATDNDFGLGIVPWHNDVHDAGGGVFGVIMTASEAPLFFPWHAGLDVLWDGYRLMTHPELQ